MASSTFGQPGQQQQQQPYMGGQFQEYGQPQRYGGGAHAGYGMLPYGAVPPAQYLPQNMPPPDGGYDADALALAQGMSSMVLAPGQQQMIQLAPGQYPYPAHQQPHMPAGYPPAGYAYSPQPQAPGLRGPAMGHQQQQQPQHPQQQQQQQHYQQPPPQQGMGPPMGPPMGMNGHHHPMDMRDMRGGPVQNGRGGPPVNRMGGPPGPGPRGMGGPQQQQMQRGGRKRVQRGLEDNVRRTVYISYIDQQVTEESLATFFADCGTVMDCRICGDPNSAMRFAFIEFMEESGAQEALKMTGSTLGKSSLRVLPSKTAIVPVNKELMPRSEEELERCSRTVYVANIDKKVEREDVRTFFEKLCGRIGKIRLLGDLQHSTRIAFIEFIDAEAAMAALNCSGALLGALPLRVSPSKTPVRGDKDDRESRQGRNRRNNNNSNNQQQQQAQQQQQGLDGSISSSASVDGAMPAAGAAAGAEQGEGPLTEATGSFTSADGAVNGAVSPAGDAAVATPVDGGVTAAPVAAETAQLAEVNAGESAEPIAEANGPSDAAGMSANEQQQQEAEPAGAGEAAEAAAAAAAPAAEPAAALAAATAP